MEATAERKGRSGPRLTPRGQVKMITEVDETLHREVKAEAARRGMSLRGYVLEILEEGHRKRVGGGE